MDVPFSVAVASSPPDLADVIANPAANRSTHDPKFENVARVSVLSVAPIVMASAARAGEKPHASLFAFPAATTTVMPTRVILDTAESRAALAEPPSDMFTTAGRAA